MSSTFSGLEVGKRGLTAHQQALHTTAHNIANADNKHYARQRVNFTAADPLYEPSLNRANVAGQIGQGVQIAEIERVRDAFVDDRIIETENQKNYWGTKQNYLSQIENIYNEPNGNTLRTLMDDFWASWEELANYPEESAHRSVVQEKARGLGSRMEDVNRKLTQLKNETNHAIESKVSLLNSLASNIATISERIGKAEALGDRPNDLYDKRDELLQQLSGIADINVGRGDEDELMVFIGQQILVQGEFTHKVELQGNPEKDGSLELKWEKTGDQSASVVAGTRTATTGDQSARMSVVAGARTATTSDNVLLRGGSLQALLEVRDNILRENIDKIDSLAINVMDVVNEIHKDGFGLNAKTNLNFFQVNNLASNSFGEFDSNGDGANDITAIFRVTGKTTINPDRPVEISGNLVFNKNDAKSTKVVIPYNEKDTLNDIIKRINQSGNGVVAYMNHDNQLGLKATLAEDNSKNNFMIRHLEDSGDLLVGMTGILRASGPDGSFDFKKLGEINKFQIVAENITLTPNYHPATFLKMSGEIATNTSSIAAARGKDVNGTGDYNTANGHKDGSNALLIASAMRSKPMMFDTDPTSDSFYNSLISKIGTETRESIQELNTQNDLMTELENLRQSVMGVSLDEEMANMVQFQHAYNASAKVISTMSEMLETIINRMGV